MLLRGHGRPQEFESSPLSCSVEFVIGNTAGLNFFQLQCTHHSLCSQVFDFLLSVHGFLALLQILNTSGATDENAKMIPYLQQLCDRVHSVFRARSLSAERALLLVVSWRMTEKSMGIS